MENAIRRAASLSCFDNPANIEPLGGGITNVNLRVSDGERDYVVRLGVDIEEHGVMRWNELALSQAAASGGFSPSVHHHEPGVLVLDYIDAKTCDEEAVRAPDRLPRIIDLLARAHRDISSELITPVLAFWPYQVIRSYCRRLQADGSAYTDELPSLLQQANELEAATGQVDLVVAHNDLLAANILDDGERLWLIDWEYGGFNSPLFDLAGLASNNHLSEVQESAMLEQYFRKPANEYWRPYQAMKCASLMRETLWSMTAEIHSQLDFDYAAYTTENRALLNVALADFKNS